MFNTQKAFAERCMPETTQGVCRSRGGESCAFDGAMIVLQCLADCAHIVHGPISCLANSYEGRGTLSKHGDLHRRGFSTAMTELDIVYGAEQKLLKAIKEAVLKTNPSAVFVYATCVSGLIGEDIEAVCKQAELEVGRRVVPVNAPGFVGPKNLGNRLAGETLLEYVIGTSETKINRSKDTVLINLIGEYNIAGDLYNVEPVLNEAGIRVLARITGNGTFEEITYAHQADLNVVVCARALINIPKVMQRRYGIPYVEVSFYGMTEMALAMRSVAGEALKLGIDIRQKVEAVINKYETATRQALSAYPSVKGKRAILYGGGVKSWAYINALRDLQIEPVAVAVKKSSYEDEQKVKDLLGDKALIFEDTSAKKLRQIYKDYSADMLIAGSRNLYIAVKDGWPYVDINQERHIALAGYEGLVEFAKQIDAGLRFYSVRPSAKPVVKAKADTALEIDPLRHSQSLGAIIAAQGFDKSTAILHGAQGCSFLSKVLLIKHFREPIALASSRLFTEDVVLGSEDKLKDTVKNTLKNAEVVVVLSTALTEVKGDDIKRAVKDVKSDSTLNDYALVEVSSPDYDGGLQEGYKKTLTALLKETLPKHPLSVKDKVSGQINIIAGCHLTARDFVELRDVVQSFGLKPIFIPDLGALDGSRQGFSELSVGGTTLQMLREACFSEISLVIGPSLYVVKDSPAELLSERCAVQYVGFDSLQSLSEIDRFFETLKAISGKSIPERYIRQRARLVDALRDAHFYLASKKAIIALEADHAIAMSCLLQDVAMRVPLAILPNMDDTAELVKAEVVTEGSLRDIEMQADVLISNSHAEDTAKRLGMPLYQVGFPSYKVIGITHKETILYNGALQTINELANLVFGGH